MNKKQWNLTDDEIAELKDRTFKRRGNYRMLEELQRLLGYEIERELAWWEGVRLRLNIPQDERHNLMANYELGKVWIKGQVPSLDNHVEAKKHHDM